MLARHTLGWNAAHWNIPVPSKLVISSHVRVLRILARVLWPIRGLVAIFIIQINSLMANTRPSLSIL